MTQATSPALPKEQTWDEHIDETLMPEIGDAEKAFENSDPVKSTSQTTDTYQQLHEENSAASQRRARLYRQEEVTDIGRALRGTFMHYQKFIKKLRNIIPARLNDFSRNGMVGFQVLVPTTRGGMWLYPQAALQFGYMSEWEVMNVNDHGLTNGTMFRGWRTVLMRLITQTYCPIHAPEPCQCIEQVRCNYISEEAAHNEFGEPTSGPDSRRYREQLWEARNKRNTTKRG